jgi:3-hydroxyisobutyrate dehydrogenase-like beta-hydroxyacid dehydrogenase
MSTIGFIGLGATGSWIAGLLVEKRIRRARQVANGLGVSLTA